MANALLPGRVPARDTEEMIFHLQDALPLEEKAPVSGEANFGIVEKMFLNSACRGQES